MNLNLDPLVTEKSPFVFHVLTSTDCNMACKYCFAEKNLKGFDLEKIIENLEILFSKWNGNLNYNDSKVCLSFTGEPMVHKEKFFKLYDYIVSKGFKPWNIEWFTNGTLFDMEKDFSRLCQSYVMFSYDGNSDQRILKDGTEVGNKVKENIKYLSDRGVIALAKPVVPIKNDYGDLYEKGLEILESGCATLRYTVERRNEYSKKDYDKLLKQFNNFYKRIYIEVKKGNLEVLSKFSLNSELYHYNHYNIYSNCAVYNPKLITIDSNGNISKCEYESTKIYCNVRDFNLSSFIEEFNKEITKNNEVPLRCSKCKTLFLCGGENSFCRYKSYYFECNLQKIMWKWFGKISSQVKNYDKRIIDYFESDIFQKKEIMSTCKEDVAQKDKHLYNYFLNNYLYWEMPIDIPLYESCLFDSTKPKVQSLAITMNLNGGSALTDRVRAIHYDEPILNIN